MSEAVFYVASDGADGNDGTEGRPFASLGRAREAVRSARAAGAGAVTVWVGGGTYYLSEPVVFGPADSGSADAPIRYQASPGEKPVLSGAVNLDLDWQSYKDGILKADLSAAGDLAAVDQLFVNGRRKHRARYPSYAPENPTAKGRGLVPTGQRFGRPPDELEFYPGEGGFNPTARWERPEEAVLHVRWFYGTHIYRLRGMDYEQNRFLLGDGGWHFNTRLFLDANEIQFSRCYVDNVFEELNTPGEWYYDKAEKALYYLPEPGEDMAAATIEAPQLRQLIEFRGDQGDPVRHITVAGFELTQTTTVFLEPWEAPSMGDWTIHRSGAVFMKGTEECAVEDSLLRATGGNAMFMDGYNVRSRVSGCTFTETGESAVCLVGHNMKRLGTARPFPDQCVIRNNHIHHLGEYQVQVAGVFLSCCQKTVVSHNDIHDVPRAAVLVNDPTWGGHVIEYNRLHRTCQDSTDHGPFNSWGRTRHWCYNQSHGPDYPSHPAGNVKEDALHTTELRHNYLEDTVGNFGVDFDDGSCNYHVHRNLLVGCPIKFRDGPHCLVENNIVIDSLLGTRLAGGSEHNGNRFIRNIVVCRRDMHMGEGYGVAREDSRRHFYHVFRPPVEGPFMEEMDSNLFWSDLGEFKACVTETDVGKRTGKGTETRVLSLEQWRKLGYDRHSVFADPMFVDAANGDYRLRPGSPALKLGFESFDTDQFGLLPEFPRHWEPQPGCEKE